MGSHIEVIPDASGRAQIVQVFDDGRSIVLGYDDDGALSAWPAWDAGAVAGAPISATTTAPSRRWLWFLAAGLVVLAVASK